MNKSLVPAGAGLLVGAVAVFGLASAGFLPAPKGAGAHKGEHGAEHGDEHGDEHGGESGTVELSVESARSAGIKVAEVTAENSVEGLDVTAVVSPNQDRLAHLGPRIPGSIMEARGLLGQEVKKGEVLAVLDAIDLGKAKAAYLKHKAIVTTAKMRVAAENSLFKRLTKLELGIEGIHFLERRDLLGVAKRNFERETKLFESKASSEKDVLASQAQYFSAQARFNASHDKLLLMGVGEAALAKISRVSARDLDGRGTTSERNRLEAMSDFQKAKAELQSACEILYTLGLQRADIDKLSHDHGQPISHFALRSPISGRILEKHATKGEIVPSGKSLYVIADLSTVWVQLDIYDRDIPRVKLGQRALVTVPGVPDQVAGKVTYLSDVVDPETRTIKARVEVKNPTLQVKPGMFVQVKLVEGSSSQSVLLLPSAAIQRMGKETIVFIQKEPFHYEKRSVSLGPRSGSRVVIRDGLTAGETVVVAGTFWLKSQLSKSKLGGGHSH